MRKIAFILVLTLSLLSYGKNILDINSSWIDQDNIKVKISKNLQGGNKVVTMIFTGCHKACPLMAKHLQDLDQKLNKKEKENTFYYLFSLDPLDEPSKLKGFAEKMNLNRRFRILSNKNENEIRELAMFLDFKYKKLDTSLYSHSMNVYLFNEKGELVDEVKKSKDSIDLKSKIKE